jgi:hypothetical protein
MLFKKSLLLLKRKRRIIISKVLSVMPGISHKQSNLQVEQVQMCNNRHLFPVEEEGRVYLCSAGCLTGAKDYLCRVHGMRG